MTRETPILIQVKLKLRWRDALKIRLAGIKNVKHLLKINIESQPTRSLPPPERRHTLIITPPGCPECGQLMEYEEVEAWKGFTCHNCDRHQGVEQYGSTT